MNYIQIKEEIGKIIEITESLPDRYKDKSFEILLQHHLNTLTIHEKTKKGESNEDIPKKENPIRIPITTPLRVFMKRNEIDEETLNQVLFYDNEDVHFIKKPANIPIAEGQIQWALLLALKNAVMNNDFKVDPEDIRSRCQAEAFYDRSNFTSIFKRPNNAKYFKGLLTANGDAQALTNDGEAELAKIISQLAGAKK